jgi:hypothetical protein
MLILKVKNANTKPVTGKEESLTLTKINELKRLRQ